MIQFKNVSKRYDNTPVVNDFSLTIQEGEFFVLIGPSGSGKTTTLKMINQLISHSEGEITIEGKPVHTYDLQELRWNIGYVLQQIALFPNLSVEENITVVPEMKAWSKEAMHERVTELLTNVGLDPDTYRKREVSELSGGEQQRIGVVRALAADPDIILMDEPFSALDPISRHTLQQDVRELQQKLKKTVVFVTHDMQEALTLGDRICLMNEGKIEQVGSPEDILQHPANDFVKEFLHTGLPHYQEEQLVADLIDKGFFSETNEQVNQTLDKQAPIDELTALLAQHHEVAIQLDEGPVTISQSDLLQYLTHERKQKKETLI